MTDVRLYVEDEDQLQLLWHPDDGDRCIVCSRPSRGKAICSDPRCAEELARA